MSGYSVVENADLKIHEVRMNCDGADRDDERIKKSNLPGKNAAVYIVGTPGSGKSNLIHQMLHCSHFYRRFFDTINIISPSIHTFAQRFKLQPESMRSKFDILEIEGILKEFEPKTKNLIVFDDSIADLNQVGRSSVIRKLILNRRHLYGSTWITSQRYNMLDKSLRVNLSHLILFKLPKQELELIYGEKISGMTRDEFLSMCNFVFADSVHNFMYIQLNPLMYFKNFDLITGLHNQ